MTPERGRQKQPNGPEVDALCVSEENPNVSELPDLCVCKSTGPQSPSFFSPPFISSLTPSYFIRLLPSNNRPQEHFQTSVQFVCLFL